MIIKKKNISFSISILFLGFMLQGGLCDKSIPDVTPMCGTEDEPVACKPGEDPTFYENATVRSCPKLARIEGTQAMNVAVCCKSLDFSGIEKVTSFSDEQKLEWKQAWIGSCLKMGIRALADEKSKEEVKVKDAQANCGTFFNATNVIAGYFGHSDSFITFMNKAVTQCVQYIHSRYPLHHPYWGCTLTAANSIRDCCIDTYTSNYSAKLYENRDTCCEYNALNLKGATTVDNGCCSIGNADCVSKVQTAQNVNAQIEGIIENDPTPAANPLDQHVEAAKELCANTYTGESLTSCNDYADTCRTAEATVESYDSCFSSGVYAIDQELLAPDERDVIKEAKLQECNNASLIAAASATLCEAAVNTCYDNNLEIDPFNECLARQIGYYKTEKSCTSDLSDPTVIGSCKDAAVHCRDVVELVATVNECFEGVVQCIIDGGSFSAEAGCYKDISNLHLKVSVR